MLAVIHGPAATWSATAGSWTSVVWSPPAVQGEKKWTPPLYLLSVGAPVGVVFPGSREPGQYSLKKVFFAVDPGSSRVGEVRKHRVPRGGVPLQADLHSPAHGRSPGKLRELRHMTFRRSMPDLGRLVLFRCRENIGVPRRPYKVDLHLRIRCPGRRPAPVRRGHDRTPFISACLDRRSHQVRLESKRGPVHRTSWER